jgi:hypothetical protein
MGAANDGIRNRERKSNKNVVIPRLPAVSSRRTRNPVTLVAKGAGLTRAIHGARLRPPAAFAFAILQTQSDRGCAASGMTTEQTGGE